MRGTRPRLRRAGLVQGPQQQLAHAQMAGAPAEVFAMLYQALATQNAKGVNDMLERRLSNKVHA